LSGKEIGFLPHHSARGGREPAHIGEALPAVTAAGNPEGSPSDPVTTDPKGEADRYRAICNTPALIDDKGAYGAQTALDPWFVTGLAEGEGCFCISFAVRTKLRTGLEARPSFSLSLNERDRRLLEDLKAFFGCGWIRESRGDRTFKYEVRSISELSASIVPHFDSFPLRGAKRRSFTGFAKVCQMIEQGDHLTRGGMRAIVDIAYETSLGKRRHAREQLLRVLGEVKG
jgi:hypothetical protein